MRRTLAPFAAILLAARIPAGAQDVRRTVAAETSGTRQLSIAVEQGAIHLVLSNGPLILDAESTPACAAGWAAAVDTMARWPVQLAPNEVAQFAPVVLQPQQPPHFTYQRAAQTSGGFAHMLLARDLGGAPLIVPMSDAKIATFTAAVRIAARLADSLTPPAQPDVCGFRYDVRPRKVVQRASPQNQAPLYFEFQVEVPAKAKPDNPHPIYPPMLASAHVEGSVLAQFVVDASGAPEPATLRILRSDHDLFTNAVKVVLPQLQFTPATISGAPVRQLVQMPFNFSVTP